MIVQILCSTMLVLIHSMQLYYSILCQSRPAVFPPDMIERSWITESTQVKLSIAMLCLSGSLFLYYVVHFVKDEFQPCDFQRKRQQKLWLQISQSDSDEDEEEDEYERKQQQERRKPPKRPINYSDDDEMDNLNLVFSDSTSDPQAVPDHHQHHHQHLSWVRFFFHRLTLLIVTAILILELIISVHPDVVHISLAFLVLVICLGLGLVVAWTHLGPALALLKVAQTPLEREAATAVASWAIPLSPVYFMSWKPEMHDAKWSWFVRYQYLWTWPIYFIFLLSFVVLFMLFVNTFGQAQPFYTGEQRRYMENHNTELQDMLISNSSFELHDNTSATVVFVILDGLRYDVVTDHPDWKDLLNDPDMAWHNDTLLLESRSAVPTVSMPNWATLVSGAFPHITGILGNSLISQITVDSITARLREFDESVDLEDLDVELSPFGSFNISKIPLHPKTQERAVIGSPMLVEMLQATLPPLGTQGAVPAVSRSANIDANTDSSTFLGLINWLAGSAYALEPILSYIRGDGNDVEQKKLEPSTESDTARIQFMTKALVQNKTQAGPRFFLLHDESADHAAHLHGVDSDEYRHTCSLYARVVRRILALVTHFMSGNNIVVVTSDHGHVTAGGHGGVAPVLRKVPLLIYYPHLQDEFQTQWTEKHVSAADIPTSIAMAMGIPTPRQSTGRWIDALLPTISPELRDAVFEDLYQQRRTLTWCFMVQSGLSHGYIKDAARKNPSLIDLDTFAEFVESDINLTRADLSALAIEQLSVVYEDAREDVVTILLTRDMLFSLAVAMVIVFLVWWRYHIHGEFRPMEATLKVVLSSVWFHAGLAVVLYLAFVLTVYNVTFAIRGYGRWDSTHAHSDRAMWQFLLTALIPGIAFMFAMQRILTLHTLSKDKLGVEFVTDLRVDNSVSKCYVVGTRIWRWFCIDFYLWRGRIRESEEDSIDFLSFYSVLMIITNVLVLIILVLESPFGVLVPLSVPIPVINSILWEFRFRISSLHIMILPLQFGSVLCYNVALHATSVQIANNALQKYTL